MSKIYVIVLSVIFSTLATGCDRPADAQTPKEAKSGEYQLRAERIVGRLEYFKDNRTGVCFAYYCWGDEESITAVPCEAIPPGLLTQVGELLKQK